MSAQIEDINYLVREEYYTITIPVPIEEPTSTITVTETVTTTIPTTTTMSSTVTATSTVTMTQTITETVTMTTTVTRNKPSWPVEFSSCYGIDDYVYVWGKLDKSVDIKDPIPYVLKVYKCGLIGCTLIGAVPFEWGSPFNPNSKQYISAKYGPISVGLLETIKIEVWSVNWSTGRYIDKVYEETVDTSVRCA